MLNVRLVNFTFKNILLRARVRVCMCECARVCVCVYVRACMRAQRACVCECMSACIERVCNAVAHCYKPNWARPLWDQATLTRGPTFLSPPPGLCRTVFFFLSAIVAVWERLQRKHDNNSPPLNLRNRNWRLLLVISSSGDLRGSRPSHYVSCTSEDCRGNITQLLQRSTFISRGSRGMSAQRYASTFVKYLNMWWDMRFLN